MIFSHKIIIYWYESRCFSILFAGYKRTDIRAALVQLQSMWHLENRSDCGWQLRCSLCRFPSNHLKFWATVTLHWRARLLHRKFMCCCRTCILFHRDSGWLLGEFVSRNRRRCCRSMCCWSKKIGLFVICPEKKEKLDTRAAPRLNFSL